MLGAYSLPAMSFELLWFVHVGVPFTSSILHSVSAVLLWHINILFTFVTGTHTNWSYFVFSVPSHFTFSSSSSGIKYITNPPSILVSFLIPDTVKPPGITAVFVPSVYSFVSVNFLPAPSGNGFLDSI